MNEVDNQDTEWLPFEAYPHQGRKLLGQVHGSNCRHGYGLNFMRLTGQTRCAYCGLDFASSYENWLTMALDHVIPANTCCSWGVPKEREEDYSNRVLACAACNTFRNRYQPKEVSCPSTLDEFYRLRDAIFIERRHNILEAQKAERDFFDRKPWMG